MSRSSSRFRTVTRNTKHQTRCVGFSSFIAKIKLVWKYWAYDTTRKTWIKPPQAVENSRWAFLDRFDAFMSEPLQANSKKGAHFRNPLLTIVERWKEKKSLIEDI